MERLRSEFGAQNELEGAKIEKEPLEAAEIGSKPGKSIHGRRRGASRGQRPRGRSGSTRRPGSAK